MKGFPLRPETSQGHPLTPLLSTPTLKLLANVIRKGNKRYSDWEGRNKTILVCR